MRSECGRSLEIVMRVYVEKPRTALGWRGLVHDPHRDGSGESQIAIVLVTSVYCRTEMLRHINSIGAASGYDRIPIEKPLDLHCSFGETVGGEYAFYSGSIAHRRRERNWILFRTQCFSI